MTCAWNITELWRLLWFKGTVPIVCLCFLYIDIVICTHRPTDDTASNEFDVMLHEWNCADVWRFFSLLILVHALEILALQFGMSYYLNILTVFSATRGLKEKNFTLWDLIGLEDTSSNHDVMLNNRNSADTNSPWRLNYFDFDFDYIRIK